MILHLHKENFVKAIELTAAKMGIEAIYVEEDYWVTYALFTIFNIEIGKAFLMARDIVDIEIFSWRAMSFMVGGLIMMSKTYIGKANL